MSPQSPPEEPKAPRKRSNIRLPKKFSPWMIVAALAIFSSFMFAQYREAQNKLNANTPAAASKQAEGVVSKVGELIILPKDQKPTVATVAHAEKLKNQAFFANAQNGDKILIYNKQKQAILYRPSTNQLVNVAAVTVAPTGDASIPAQ